MTPLENFDKMEDFDMPVEERKTELRNRLYKIKDKCPHLKETVFLYEGKFDKGVEKILQKNENLTDKAINFIEENKGKILKGPTKLMNKYKKNE